MKSRTWTAVLGLISTITSAAAPASAAPWVTAYYPAYEVGNPAPANIDFRPITDLVFFSLTPTNSGGLTDTGGVDSNAASVATATHNAGKKVLICIGGSGTEPAFASALGSSTSRTSLVNNIVAWVRNYGYDGVDIDDEPMASNDGPNYQTFITSLRSALGSGKLLTAAIEPYGYPSIFAPIQSSFDQLNMMTYDLSGSWTGVSWFNSNLSSGSTSNPVGGGQMPSCQQALSNCTGAGLTASKLAIGTAFYGYAWTNMNAPLQTIPSNDTITAYSYAYIMTNLYSPGAYVWDSDATAPYLHLASTFVSYDDPTLCSDKVDYVVNNALGGLVCWEVGQQYMPDGSQPLLASIYNELVANNALPTAPAAPTGLTATASGA